MYKNSVLHKLTARKELRLFISAFCFLILWENKSYVAELLFITGFRIIISIRGFTRRMRGKYTFCHVILMTSSISRHGRAYKENIFTNSHLAVLSRIGETQMVYEITAAKNYVIAYTNHFLIIFFSFINQTKLNN